MINAEKVKHIAGLARLQLSEEEAAKMAGELGKVLGYIDELNKVDTDGVEPTAQVSGLTNRTRPDTAVSWPAEERQTALQQAEIQDGLVKVNKIL